MDRRSALKRTGLLTGATISLPAMLSLLESCKQEPRLDWQPKFFTTEEVKTIGTLADMILPRTDTPGALDVKVDVFIDKVIAETYDQAGQEGMRKEITDFNQGCIKEFGDLFYDLSLSKRREVLEKAESSTAKFNPGIWGKTVGKQEPVGFYRSIKAMTIWAYFSSEEVGEKVLSYDPIPGNYKGCIPLIEVGNKWSL
ncbi:MAG: gluconate 2-dehydrogenase subunit 3 family protein [Flavobacteriaceae bacterium]